MSKLFEDVSFVFQAVFIVNPNQLLKREIPTNDKPSPTISKDEPIPVFQIDPIRVRRTILVYRYLPHLRYRLKYPYYDIIGYDLFCYIITQGSNQAQAIII